MALAAPTGLAGISTFPHIALTWSDKSTGEEYYEVERSPNGSTGWTSMTAILDPDTESWTDTTVQAAQTWYYRVRAIITSSPAENGAWSNVASVTSLGPMIQPRSITAVRLGSHLRRRRNY